MKRAVALFTVLLVGAQAWAADFYRQLEAGERVYQDVYVLSANESSLSIRHSRGLSQVPLADLGSKLQLKYGYSPQSDRARSERLERLRERQARQATQRLERQIKVAEGRSRMPRGGGGAAPEWLRAAFARFGSPPELQSERDLRPLFRQHGIGIRRQRGPSCSVHAVAAALEFQYAEKQGKRVKVSESYLVGATSRALGRRPLNEVAADGEPLEAVSRDEGFALEHVFQAIRGHGLVVETSEEGLSQEQFQEELRDVNFSPFQIPGGRDRVGIANIVHVLNAGMPVVVGVGWSADARVQRTSLLSKQLPLEGAGHAVTLVGYRCETGRLEDAKFIFRNSWGPRWGAGGYGFFTYEYLENNLFSAYVVELR